LSNQEEKEKKGEKRKKKKKGEKRKKKKEREREDYEKGSLEKKFGEEFSKVSGEIPPTGTKVGGNFPPQKKSGVHL